MSVDSLSGDQAAGAGRATPVPLHELAMERAEALVAHLGMYGPLLATLIERPGENPHETAQLLKTNALRRYAALRAAVCRKGFDAWPAVADASVLGAITDRVCELWRVRSRIEERAPMHGFVAAYECCDRVLLRYRPLPAAEPNSMAYMRVSNMLALGDLSELVIRHRFGQDSADLVPAIGHQIALAAVRAAMRFSPLPAGEAHPVEQLHVLLAQGALLMTRLWQEAVEEFSDSVSSMFGEGLVRDIVARWTRTYATMIALAEADASKRLNAVPRSNAAALHAALAYSACRPTTPTVSNIWGESSFSRSATVRATRASH